MVWINTLMLCGQYIRTYSTGQEIFVQSGLIVSARDDFGTVSLGAVTLASAG